MVTMYISVGTPKALESLQKLFTITLIHNHMLQFMRSSSSIILYPQYISEMVVKLYQCGNAQSSITHRD